MKNKLDFFPVKMHDQHNNIIRLKVSCLYSTLEDLKKLESPLLSDITLKYGVNKPVIYIYFNTDPIYNIYHHEYQFKERHLTIHKFYKESSERIRNGLSIAHYTETYSCTKDNKQIVIHVYFDNQGFYQYTQIKQYEGKRNEANFVKLSCHSESEKLFRENAQDASDFLQELINQNQKLCHEAMLNAESIELKLSNISQTFENVSIQLYQQTADEFIKAIEQINRHNDNHDDKRDLLVKQQMEYILNSNLNNKEAPAESEAETTKEQDSKTTPIQKQVKIKKHKQYEYDKILSLEIELNSLTNELQKSKNDISLLIKKSELVTQIRLMLLIISSDFPFLKLNQKNRLNQLSKNLVFNQDLKKVFIEEFWKGNIEGVKLLYPHVERQITFMFLSENIFWPLVFRIPSSQEYESKLRIVFDFLYKESSEYRFVLSNKRLLLYAKEGKCGLFSLLVHACHEGNLFAFKLLLEQGMNPNDTGLLIGEVHIPALFCISDQEDSTRHVYLQEALKFGAHYNCKPALLSIDYKRSKHLNIKLDTKSLSILNTTLKTKVSKELNEVLDCQHFLHWLCSTDCFVESELFLPQLTFIDALSVFVNLSSRTNIRQRHLLPGNRIGCMVAKNLQDVATITTNVIDFSTKLYSILIYSEGPSPHINLIEKLADNVQNQIQHLTTAHPDLLKKIYDDLYTAAKSASMEKHYVWQFDACLYLLVCEPNPTVMTYQSIMQIYCHLAGRAAKNTINNSFSMYFYNIAKNIAELSAFAFQLKSTPIYQHIKKKTSDVTNNVDNVRVSNFPFVNSNIQIANWK
jgi:hypothetical protein